MDTPVPHQPPSAATGGVTRTGRGVLLSQAQAVIDSAALLQGKKAVAISHNGELYRLQATRQGKLILTK